MSNPRQHGPPPRGDGVWRPQHCDGRGYFPEGWFASRSHREAEAGRGLLCQTAGRFETEADCRFWCDAFNGGTAEEQERARQLAHPVPGM